MSTAGTSETGSAASWDPALDSNISIIDGSTNEKTTESEVNTGIVLRQTELVPFNPLTNDPFKYLGSEEGLPAEGGLASAYINGLGKAGEEFLESIYKQRQRNVYQSIRGRIEKHQADLKSRKRNAPGRRLVSLRPVASTSSGPVRSGQARRRGDTEALLQDTRDELRITGRLKQLIEEDSRRHTNKTTHPLDRRIKMGNTLPDVNIYPFSTGVSNSRLFRKSFSSYQYLVDRADPQLLGRDTRKYVEKLLGHFVEYNCLRKCRLPFVISALGEVIVKGPLTDYETFILLSCVEETASVSFLNSAEWQDLEAIHKLIACLDLLRHEPRIVFDIEAQGYFIDRILNAENRLIIRGRNIRGSESFWNKWIANEERTERVIRGILSGSDKFSLRSPEAQANLDKAELPSSVLTHGGKPPPDVPLSQEPARPLPPPPGSIGIINLLNRQIGHFDDVMSLVVKFWLKKGAREMESDHPLIRPWKGDRWDNHPEYLKYSEYKKLNSNHILVLEQVPQFSRNQDVYHRQTDWRLYYGTNLKTDYVQMYSVGPTPDKRNPGRFDQYGRRIKPGVPEAPPSWAKPGGLGTDPRRGRKIVKS